MAEIPVILLAAGDSKRMGQPKQLLPWGKQTLICHQIEILLETGQPLVVVLGANAEKIIPEIKKFQITVAVNQNWEDGMGTSVGCGIKKLQREFPKALGAMLALIDQPLVPVSHYTSLLSRFSPGEKQIVASRSNEGWLGVPAVFDRFYFDELLQLEGDTGAKTIIRKYPHQVISVEGGDFLNDMDTPESYRRLQNQ